MHTVVRLFTAHPASVGESYVQHLRAALGFALGLQLAALACALHALLPFLLRTAGSRRIEHLYGRMVADRRRALTPAQSAD